MTDRRGTGTPPDLWTRVSLEIRRDKKKTTIMAGLVLLAAVMAGRMIVSQSGPAEASASTSAVAKVATTADDGAQARGDQQELIARRNEYITGITPGITRDLFKFTPEAFTLASPPIPTISTPAVQPVDKAKAFEELKKQLTAIAHSRARGLKLQSTIVGDSPIAIINGELVRVGRSVGGFTVVSIANRKCEIETEVEYIVDKDSKKKAKQKVKLTLVIEGWQDKSPGNG